MTRNSIFAQAALRIFFVLPLIAWSAFGQKTKEERLQPSCGPQSTKFDVHTTKGHADPTIEANHANVYVAEIFVRPAFPVSGPTVRVGVDGNWMGAVRGTSYLAFAVAPGEHHVCLQRQSFQQSMSRQAALTSFTAEAGKSYYFRAYFAFNIGLTLEPVDQDEGRYLTSRLALSVSHPKQ